MARITDYGDALAPFCPDNQTQGWYADDEWETAKGRKRSKDGKRSGPFLWEWPEYLSVTRAAVWSLDASDGRIFLVPPGTKHGAPDKWLVYAPIRGWFSWTAETEERARQQMAACIAHNTFQAVVFLDDAEEGADRADRAGIEELTHVRVGPVVVGFGGLWKVESDAWQIGGFAGGEPFVEEYQRRGYAAAALRRRLSLPIENTHPIVNDGWDLKIGQVLPRPAVHERWGGRLHTRISPSKNGQILLFGAGSHEYDGWDEDGLYHYIGEGQSDHLMTQGNQALLNHRDTKRAVRLFADLPGGLVRYLGQFVCDDPVEAPTPAQPLHEEWPSYAEFPDEHPDRHIVFVFRLRPVEIIPGPATQNAPRPYPRVKTIPF